MISYLKIALIVLHTSILSVFALISILIDKSFNIYFFISKIFGNGVLLISRIKLDIIGLENFDKNETYVFVSNHSSMLDIPALISAIPNKFCIVFKKELAKIPVFGWQLKYGPYIIIDRQNPENAMQSIEIAKSKMTDRKFSVLLFAEGTRSKTGEVQPFKRGAFYLASRVNHPIIPVAVSGTEKILPKGKFIFKKGTIKVVFDKPISTDNIKNKVDELNLMEKVREIIIKNKL